ncbi:protein disulfide-isomerase A3-like [Lineus longissimus]|uniref:protein disulfide-isomerase A3-like n=1 Tax=Lineus longissimus TaxID=88925 RepID=UPI002B4EA306
MMRPVLLFSAVFCALAAASDVVELGDANFQSTLEGFDTALVKFYAPWCGHCKRLAPEFDDASSRLLANDPPVHLVKVDCTADGKDSCSKHGVSGYPTLKIFKNGEVASDYDGPRQADGIVSFMKKQAGPSSKEMSTAAEIKDFTAAAGTDHSVVGFFTSDTSALAKSFKKFADKSDLFRFGHTYDADAANELGKKDTVVVYRPASMSTPLEESTVTYEAGVDLETWIKENAFGVVGLKTAGNEGYFKSRPLCTVYYDVDYLHNAKGSNYWRNRVMKVGKKFVNKEAFFAIANLAAMTQEAQECGLAAEPGSKDPIVCCKDQKERKYKMTEKFSLKTFESFVNSFLDGKVEAFIKSEPVPASNDGPVKVVVGSEFDKIVNDETKDVLIEFYAPWCGHCKSLEPKYNELGEKLKANENLVIAKMDATANDVPAPYDVRGFPTIYFSPKGDKQNPKKYEMGREVPDFIKYLKNEASDPIVEAKSEL